MINHRMITSVIAATCVLSGTAFAQQTPHMSHHEQMMRSHHMPMPMGMGMDAPMTFKDFPTADELARMTPPDPMTEEKIKQRFAKRKSVMNKVLEKDRKAAEKYAQEFSRFQKHQSDSLAQLMARAEKRREQMLQRLDEQEQQVLENFRKHTTPAENTAAPEASR